MRQFQRSCAELGALVDSFETQRGASPAAARLPALSLPTSVAHEYKQIVTHAQLVKRAVEWLRAYACGIVLSEQACVSGEMPDAIGWKRGCHSVLVECKVSRADFLADRAKPFRQKGEQGLGCERFYLTPRSLLAPAELPTGWGLLECHGRRAEIVRPSRKNLRSDIGLRHEMNLLLASLRRVEIRIEPESITDFLKWKNRMAEYNRGTLPKGISSPQQEPNAFLEVQAAVAEDDSQATATNQLSSTSIVG